MRIYTKTGDEGDTGLVGGRRVSKADLRIVAIGAIDELNAHLGHLACRLGTAAPDMLREALVAPLQRVQRECFEVGARLAGASAPDESEGTGHGAPISDDAIAALEAAIDRAEESLEPLRRFCLPGGCENSARLHVARAVCRRAERDIVALQAHETVDAAILRYVNRLSDLLFVWARLANHHAGVPDILW